jgi:hypothetical protein
MAMLSCILAEDSHGVWRITFEPEERHLFVHHTGRPEPLDWMSIDDFMAWLPGDDTHRWAINRLVELIGGAFEQAQ